jgi:hypothetical protein
MTARFLTIHVTAGEAEASRRVRLARDKVVRGHSSEDLFSALQDPCIALLLSEIADTWESTPESEDEL